MVDAEAERMLRNGLRICQLIAALRGVGKALSHQLTNILVVVIIGLVQEFAAHVVHIVLQLELCGRVAGHRFCGGIRIAPPTASQPPQ